MKGSYHSICQKYNLKDDYFDHRTNHDSIGTLEFNICLYDKVIEIRVMKKNKFILSLSISEDSFGMFEPNPKITIGRDRCLEVLRENHPEVFEWCLWNL